MDTLSVGTAKTVPSGGGRVGCLTLRPEPEVIDYNRSQSGAHFDPRAAELFLRILEETGCDDPIR